MNQYKPLLILFLLLASFHSHAQLGFCNGSKGEAIFSENFGNGTNYGPALPAGITNYAYVTGAPNDGMYTLYYRTNLYSTWHYSLDHTPDASNGTNGKALLVNANASTSGDFYKRTVTGLCINTTFEFSAWVMNVYNPGSGFCGASEIPINVRFEIWNDTETVLLSSGNTGSIMGTATPTWQQFALVFTTANQTSVVLKMKNNGLGGCGNDLAIDDIEFNSCGDLTTVTSPSAVGTTFTTCSSPVSLQLDATTTGSSPHFYQWQSSTDGTNWTDIAGANAASYITPNLTTPTFFRTKVAQDVANLSNNFCSTISDVFTVSFLTVPAPATTNGDVTICSNQPIPALSVTPDTNASIDWYDALTGGNLLLSNSNSYTPTAAGIYYAETYNATSTCRNATRTAVTLTIIQLPFVTISGTPAVCNANTGTITFTGTPNAIVTYTVDGSNNQFITLDNNGVANITTPALSASSTYTLVNVTSSVLNTCMATVTNSFTVTVNPAPTATATGSNRVCINSSTTININGTPDAVVTYTENNGPNQTITLTAGQATITTPILTAATVYNFTSITSTGTNACTEPLTQSFPITVIPLPTATIAASTPSVCANNTATLTFTGTADAIITYSVNNGSNQTVTLNNLGNATVTTAPITIDTTFQLLTATLSGTNACSQPLSDSVTVTINPTPTASYTGNTIYCSHDPLAISLNSNTPGTTFSWTATSVNANGATDGTGNTINQTITTAQATGTVTYTVTPLFNGCAGTPITIPVTIHPLPNPTITSGTICLNNSNTTSQPYTLNTNLNPADHTFQWFNQGVLLPSATSSTYNATQVGTYSVIATNTNTGCVSNTTSANVTETVKGQALLIDQSNAFSDNPSITVTVVGGTGPFLYQLDNGPFQYSNVFEQVPAGYHTIMVVDESYCTNLSSTVTIINYPHYFTPNNDGVHDSWNIQGLVTPATILIYDRYGKIIKQIKSNTAGWDGTYNGEKMFSTDYWFTIDYEENGIIKTFRSHFSLKR